MDIEWDCIIVGGGAAGLSAGLVLGRARKRTLLVDAGAQSNLAAQGIGGLLGHDGRSPAELYQTGRRELSVYPSVEVRTGEVVAAEGSDGGFILQLADGRRERARRVLLATGMQYRQPALRGIDRLWGGSAFHCPFCHGWEVRDRPLGVLARGERALHSALLLRGWSDDIVVLTDGPADLEDDERAQLAAANISIDERRVAELASENGELTAVVFADGTRLARAGLLVATTLHQRSTLADQLGAAPAEPTPVAENPLAIDGFYRTTASGVFAAGDLSVQMPQVAAAIASGSQAAAAVVQSLMADDYGLAVPEGRTASTPDAKEHWEQHYGERDRVWSGRVNAVFAEIVASLTPGTALDLGCGEGGDAMWLAERGWQVVAVDISETALNRAAEDADARGVGDRIEFRAHDLSEGLPEGAFDLVAAQFLHSTLPLDRTRIFKRAADVIRPGGLLLIVDHGKAPPWASKLHHDHEFPSADEVVAALEFPDVEWERVRVGPVEREATGPNGQTGTLVDNVIVLRRRTP